jgi:WD40 repeat protein
VQTLTTDMLSPVNCLALTHDRTKLFCGHNNGWVVIWDIKKEKGIQLSTFRYTGNDIICVLVANDDSAFISVSSCELIRRDLDSDVMDFFIDVAKLFRFRIRSAVLSADSSLVYCCTSTNIIICNAITGELLSEISKEITSRARSFWKVGDITCIARAGASNALVVCAYSCYGHSLILLESDSSFCFEYHGYFFRDEMPEVDDAEACSVSLSHVGDRVMCGLGSGNVFVGHSDEDDWYDLSENNLLLRDPPQRLSRYAIMDPICGVAISADGALGASGSPDNTIAVWDLNKMFEFHKKFRRRFNYPSIKLEGHTGQVLAVLFF